MKKSFFIFFLILANYFIMAQDTNDVEGSVTAVAELIDVMQSGKRHNSYLLTFKIKKVHKGKIEDSTMSSQEIYHDFGASQIFSKINLNKSSKIPAESNQNEVIIKYLKHPTLTKVGELMWVAEKERWKSLEKLEKLLYSNFKTRSTMLSEKKGKLYIKDNEGINKILVESKKEPGNWYLKD